MSQIAYKPVFSVVADEIAARAPGGVFGVMGEDTAGITAELIDGGIPYFAARHEGTAVSMADGYAWATGDTGVCLLTRGPGVINALNAARTAVMGQRSLLLIAGDVATSGPTSLDLKYVDHGPLAAAIGLEYFAASDAPAAVHALRRGFAAAARGRASLVSIPVDVLDAAAAPQEFEPIAAPETAPAAAPTDAELERIIDLLQSSHCPLILAGAGALEPGVRDLLVELAERSGSLLGTSLRAKDLFRGSPLDVGVVGGFASDPAAHALGEVDCVIVFGASLTLYTTARATLFRGAQVVHIDRDAGRIGANFPVELGVVADAGTAARRLLDVLSTAAGDGVRRDQLPLVDPAAPLYQGPDESADRLDPRILAMALDQLLPADRSLLLDAGRFTAAPARCIRVTGPNRFRYVVEGGSIGQALGVAMGAAVGRHDVTHVACIGDGGLAMSMQDLDTLARYQLPLIVLVMNDSSYGAERGVLAASGHSPTVADFVPETDFARIAAAHGIESATVSTLDELRSHAGAFQGRATPLLLDCRINPEVTTAHLEW